MKDYTLDIKDKVAVVTGAGGVLCSMFSKTLAEQGAKVALLDLNGAAVENTILLRMVTKSFPEMMFGKAWLPLSV